MGHRNVTPLYKKTFLFGMGFVFFVSMLLFLLEWRNHGINLPDFEVYYRSALRLLNGDNLYRIESDGHFIFKYSPACAMMFIPFTIFAFPVAKILYWIFLTGITAYTFFLCIELAKPGLYSKSASKFNLYIFIMTLSLGLFLYREFMLGQVNLVLFLSYLLAIRFYQKKRFIPTAIVLAAGIMFKPWGFIFIPYFLIKKDFKVILYFALFSVLIALAPIIFYGYSDLIEQTGRWIHELMVELGNKQVLGSDANHTIFSVIYRYSPLRFIEIAGLWQLIYQLIVLLLLAILVLIFIFNGSELKQSEIANGALLIGLMPLIAQPSYNAFLLVALALTIVLVYFKQMPKWGKIVFISGAILMAGNYNDLWGTELSDWFLDLSLVAIGAIFVLILLLFLRFKRIA